jgi:hypothetical protein
MAKATKAKQISLVTPNKVGMLAKVSTAIAEAKVNMNALCAYAMKNKAYFMILADRHIKVKNALIKAKLRIAEEDVVLVEMPNKPGEMQKVAQKIADAGIDIIYVYGSAEPGKKSYCVFKTNNDGKAIKAIKGK